MLATITPLDIIPYVVLALPWLMAIGEIRRGLAHGEMVWFRRGSGGDNLGDDPPPNVCRREDEPNGFRALFGMYVVIVLLVPILIVGSILHKVGYVSWLD